MSKSVGNVILPQKVMQNLGADVLRLWVASTDYANEISVSDEILKRMADSYRRMRNTLRFLLGNLHGFDLQADALPATELIALDRWALQRAANLQAEIIEAYRRYEFHAIYQKVHNFCINDLGGLYLDVLKDRLYVTPAKGRPRRSAQTALWHIAEAMVRWLAPILSFTADETWGFLPGDHRQSVFAATWHKLPDVIADGIDWPALIALRAGVAQELEVLRVAGKIGAPLDARVEVLCLDRPYAQLATLGSELRFFLITSEASVLRVASAPSDAKEVAGLDGVWLRVSATQALKCERCWHRCEDVGAHAAHPALCGRCIVNIDGSGEQREFA